MAQKHRDPSTPFVLEVKLDRNSPIPLYQQIAIPLREMISSGELAPGQLIEDEVSMARRLSISRQTARSALSELVSAGLVNRRRGAGTRVAFGHVHRPLALTSLNEDLIRAGHATHTDILNYSITLADKQLADALNCAEGDELVTIDRLRYMDDSPLALMKNTIPQRFAPSLKDLTEQGLYECFHSQGIELSSAVQVLGAINASAHQAEILDLEPGAALVTVERTSYDAEGNGVEIGLHVYDAAQYRMTIPLFAEAGNYI